MKNWKMFLSILLAFLFGLKIVVSSDIVSDGFRIGVSSGDNAERGEFPWMVALLYKLPGGEIEIGCGGSLINKYFVLTAAHCIRAFGIQLVGVRLRAYNISTKVDCVDNVCSDSTIKRTIIHPNYTGNPQLHNDIALIHLGKEVTPSKYAQPILLPQNSMINDSMSALTVLGFGATGPYSGPLPVLQKAQLTLANREKCLDHFKDSMHMIDSQLCVGGFDHRDSCKGDSGGPLVQFNKRRRNYEQVGIVSYGSEFCGQIGVAGVYTKVFDFIPWIESTIES